MVMQCYFSKKRGLKVGVALPLLAVSFIVAAEVNPSPRGLRQSPATAPSTAQVVAARSQGQTFAPTRGGARSSVAYSAKSASTSSARAAPKSSAAASTLALSSTAKSAPTSGASSSAAPFVSSSSLAKPVADTQAPTAPTGLKVAQLLNKSLSLSWQAAQDNTGVVGYTLARNGLWVGFVTTNVLAFTDTGLSPNSLYSYSVKAQDAAGNTSPAALLNIKTLSVSGPVTLTWQAPTERQDGSYLNPADIAGFKVRYKLNGASEYTQVAVAAGVSSYALGFLQGDYSIEVATEDTQGALSSFEPVVFL